MTHIDSDNTHLLVVGRGNAIRSYENIARSLELNNVTFTGYVSDATLAGYYAAARVLVLPSTTRSEGFGMVILEAAACGTPSVASHIGGISEAIVDGQTGILVPAGDATKLAVAIRRVLEDDVLHARLGEAAAKRVAHCFTWDQQVKQTERVFVSVIEAAK